MDLGGGFMTILGAGSATLGFASGVAQRIVAAALIAVGKKFDINEVFPLRNYKRRLLARMEDMPFLYKDMRLSARDDYVEPQLATASNSTTQQAHGNPNLDFRTPFTKFHESRRAIVFGEGGYGKTTLFRHLTIRTLQQRRSRPVLDGPRLVPVFVALKTVRLSDFSILDAIQRSDPYFDGPLGLKRLTRLAKRKRLLLFLDGYDEMPHAGGLAHVVRELETIFDNYSSLAPTFFEASEHGHIYRAIQGCRVYLSSRREFFFYSPIEVGSNVQRWIVKGLDDRRIELVEKIFDNYRVSSGSSSGVDLDAELFMQELKKTGDDELHQLSRSPLFLTVMCFVYVRGVTREGRSSVFSRGAYDIIHECIRLLISELDAAKAKGLTGAQRLALTNRRAAFPEEKIEFLQHFAVKLYDSSIGLFDREQLQESAQEFFRSMSDSPNCDEILRGLRKSDATVSIVEQIILSGIFVLVDRYRSTEYFDFPHRRFRETLAVTYFNSATGAERLSSHLHETAYGELILVFVEQSSYRGVLIKALTREVVAGRDAFAMANLLSAALARVPEVEASEALAELLDAIAPRRVPELPKSLLKYLSIDSASSRWAREKVRSAVELGNAEFLALWLEVAAITSRGTTQALLSELAVTMDFKLLRAVLFSRLGTIEGSGAAIVEEFLRKGVAEGSGASALADVLSLFYAGRGKKEKKQFRAFLASLFSKLSEERESSSDALRKAIGQAIERIEGEEEEELEVRNRPAPFFPWRSIPS
jgi:hypothetical protein